MPDGDGDGDGRGKGEGGKTKIGRSRISLYYDHYCTT